MNKLNFIKSYTSLPRNVYILFAADIINSAGSFVYPLLALFLTIKLGFSENYAGFLLTIVIAAEGAGRLIGGKLSDVLGRKIVIVSLSLAGSLFFIIIAFLENPVIIPYLIILAGFLKSGAFPAINALIIDSTGRKSRNDAFSLLYLGHNIGFAIGPLAAGFLFLDHINLIFLIDALTTIIAVVPIMFFVKETFREKRSTGNDYIEAMPDKEKDAAKEEDIDENEKAENGNVVSIFFRKPVLAGFAFISIILSFIYVQVTFALPISLENLFSQNGPRYYGILMTINAIIVIFITMLLVSALKKINPILNIAISGGLFAVGFGMLYFSKLFFLFIISTAIWTLGEIINSVSSNVLIANYSPVSHRGRFNAIIYFISGAGFAAGPLIMGTYLNYFGEKNVWPLLTGLSILASVLMFILFLFERRNKKSPFTNKKFSAEVNLFLKDPL